MGHLAYSTELIFDDINHNEDLINLLKAEQLAWNECSKVKFNNKIKNSIVDLHKAFYRNFRDNHPEIPSVIVVRAENEILSTFRSIKSKNHKIKCPPIKKKLSLRLDAGSFSYKNKIFSILSLKNRKRIKCKLYLYPKLEELLNKYNFCDPMLYEKNNKIRILMIFKTPPLTDLKQSLSLGIDLGSRVNAATSEGTLFMDKSFNARKRQLRFLRRKLQSNNSKSAKKHLQKISHKEHNINNNFSHHLVNALIKSTKADTLVLENLKSIKVKKNKYKTKNRISQIPLFRLKQILTYKAPFYGKTVIEVCPSYTSQIDSFSGLKDGIRKGRRYYSKSGLVYDSDVNGAINIGRRSKLPVSISNYLDGQAIVNSPFANGSGS